MNVLEMYYRTSLLFGKNFLDIFVDISKDDFLNISKLLNYHGRSESFLS